MAHSVGVLHVMESWRPVVSGYTSRSWELVRAQGLTGDIRPHVLVTSRQQTYGAASVEELTARRGAITAVAPSRREQLVRWARPYYVDRTHLAEAIRRVCAEARPDIIHSHWSSGIGQAAARVADQLNLPLVAEMRFDLAGAVMTETVRAAIPCLERLLRRRFEPHATRARAVVAASYSLADLLREEFPWLASRLSVVPNAVDCHLFRPVDGDGALKRSLGLDGKFVVGSTSNMLRYEGLDVLLQALRRLRAAVPHIHALFVGSGTQHQPLRREAATWKIPATFTGRVPSEAVPRYLGAMDLFVVPRRDASITRYASPIKVVEAMACGLPVVGSAVGDVPLLLGEERGVLTRPDAVDELAEAIIVLSRDQTRCRTLGRRARTWAETHMSWDKTADRYRAMYRGIGRREVSG